MNSTNNYFEVQKGWGYEKWITNTEKYCGKLLYFNKGKKCSWHYHNIKDEVFYIQSGRIELFYGYEDDKEKSKIIILVKGDSFHVPVGLRHQMFAKEETELFEFSTQHFEEDSIRVEKGD
jgi:mannose-6-phosphate isomerase-like protein (cupin superfamily)